MSNSKLTSPKVLYILGIVFVIWGILGMQDSKNYVTAGYQSGDDNAIINIDPDSPAEKAGMQVGDVILTSDGIDINNRKELIKRERPIVGQMREFVVLRNGEEVVLTLTYEGLSDKDKTLNMIAFMIGLIFVLIGMWAAYKHQTALGQTFSIFALCFGFIFMSGPDISAGFLENLVNSISTTIVVFSFAFLLSLMLQYPPESKKFKWLFIPALLAALMSWILNFVQPDSSSSLNMFVRLFFGAVIIFYFVVSLVTLIKKYSKASADLRSAGGLTLMLVGAVVGLVPILIYFTASYLSPGIDLPGNDYVFISFLAIPICFMLALNKVHQKPAEA